MAYYQDNSTPQSLVAHGAQMNPLGSILSDLRNQISTISSSAPVGPQQSAAAPQQRVSQCASGFTATSTLRSGSRGAAVTVLQCLIKSFDPTPTASGKFDDGSFGPRTAAAVRAFQTSVRITSDGIVGPNTWRALGVGVGTGTAPSAPLPVVSDNQQLVSHRFPVEASSNINWGLWGAVGAGVLGLGVIGWALLRKPKPAQSLVAASAG